MPWKLRVDGRRPAYITGFERWCLLPSLNDEPLRAWLEQGKVSLSELEVALKALRYEHADLQAVLREADENGGFAAEADVRRRTERDRLLRPHVSLSC